MSFQVTETWQSVCEFLHRTLCYVQNTGLKMQQEAEQALTKLIELDLVKQTPVEPGTTVTQNPTSILHVTRIGRAVFKGMPKSLGDVNQFKSIRERVNLEKTMGALTFASVHCTVM